MKSAGSGLKVQTAVKSGGIASQHNRRVMNVRTGVKAGGRSHQHNRRLLKSRSARG